MQIILPTLKFPNIEVPSGPGGKFNNGLLEYFLQRKANNAIATPVNASSENILNSSQIMYKYIIRSNLLFNIQKY